MARKQQNVKLHASSMKNCFPIFQVEIIALKVANGEGLVLFIRQRLKLYSVFSERLHQSSRVKEIYPLEILLPRSHHPLMLSYLLEITVKERISKLMRPSPATIANQSIPNKGPKFSQVLEK